MLKAVEALKNIVSMDLAIDMGTANTRVYIIGQGLAVDEPTFIAIDSRTQEVHSVGEQARKLYGRAPADIEVHRPVRKGAIEHFEMAELLLRKLLAKHFRWKSILGARVVVMTPTGATDVEKKAFEDMAALAGAREVFLAEETLSCAVGQDLPLFDARGCLAVSVGAGATQAALFSAGGVVLSQCLRVGGDDLNDAIISGLKRKFNLLVGYNTAEAIKQTLGSAYPIQDDSEYEIYGKDMLNGAPRAMTLDRAAVRDFMAEPMNQIVNQVKSALELLPPDQIRDVKRRGLFISGGSSKIDGFCELLEKATGVECRPSENAEYDAINGARLMLSDVRRFGGMFTASNCRRFLQ